MTAQPLTGKVGISLELAARVSQATDDSRCPVPVQASRGALPSRRARSTRRFASTCSASSLEANDFVSVQASRDGYQLEGSRPHRGPANDAQPTKVAFDISPFISADTAIRFVNADELVACSIAMSVQIDNVEIGYDSVYATGVSYPVARGRGPATCRKASRDCW